MTAYGSGTQISSGPAPTGGLVKTQIPGLHLSFSFPRSEARPENLHF